MSQQQLKNEKKRSYLINCLYVISVALCGCTSTRAISGTSSEVRSDFTALQEQQSTVREQSTELRGTIDSLSERITESNGTIKELSDLIREREDIDAQFERLINEIRAGEGILTGTDNETIIKVQK